MPEVLATRRSPLHGRSAISAPDGAVRLAEAAFLGKWILRANAAEASGPVGTILGATLPVAPLSASVAGDTALLWMGPDEWMLVTAPDLPANAQALGASLAGTHHQLVDVSDYYTALDIAGLHARELLMKLTTLDLHPREFHAGMVTGSVFGRANATIWQTSDGDETGPSFRLFVRWSMADYLWCLLAECGREWQLPEQRPIKGERLTIEQ